MKSQIAALTAVGLWVSGGLGWAQNVSAPAVDESVRPIKSLIPLPATPSQKTQSGVSTQGGNISVGVSSQGEPSGSEEVGPVALAQVDLETAIRTLAKQAHINIMLDPQISMGLPGPEGKPQPFPTVDVQFENVTYRQALEAILDNYGLTMVLDPKTQIARITVQKPGAPEPLITKVIQLKYSDPTNMVSLIQPMLGNRSRVIADPRTSQLVLMATEGEQASVQELIDKLDTATKQVLIEAKMLETSQNPTTVKGLDWTETLQKQNVSFGNGVTRSQTDVQSPGAGTTTTLPDGRIITSTGGSDVTSTRTTVLDSLGGVLGMSLNTSRGFNPETAFLNADGVKMVMSFLNSEADTRVLATPRAVTLDNEQAKLSVTRSFPIFKITPGSPNTPAGAEITYTNVGTILTVTPRISAKTNVAMKVEPEVSNIDSKDRQTINGQVNEANVYAIRRIEANVVVPSGNTLVMGGLISDSSSQTYAKVPILGDLPGPFGLLFRKDSKSRTKSNLLIFITPTIIQDDDFQPAHTDFLQTPTPVQPEEQVSPWDSGRPYNWSKPAR